MYWDVVNVQTLDNYELLVEIADGRRGVFDVKPYLEFGVFQELKNPQYFERVAIEHGALTWPNEQDIAPENLLSEMTFIELA